MPVCLCLCLCLCASVLSVLPVLNGCGFSLSFHSTPPSCPLYLSVQPDDVAAGLENDPDQALAWELQRQAMLEDQDHQD